MIDALQVFVRGVETPAHGNRIVGVLESYGFAGYDRLTARKSRRDGMWYIADARNFLVSPEQGLDDAEGLEWLLQADGPA